MAHETIKIGKFLRIEAFDFNDGTDSEVTFEYLERGGGQSGCDVETTVDLDRETAFKVYNLLKRHYDF